MEIRYKQASRIFGKQVVFQNLDLHIKSGSKWAILGANGSGKSTLLKCSYGALSLSSGEIQHKHSAKDLNLIEAAKRIGYSAPYFELIEELPALELLQTLARFRPWRKDWSAQEILKACLLEDSKNKLVSDFSSGMKQRLRLGVALAAETDLIILDEPSSNLDRQGLKWYQDFLEAHLDGRTLIVGTNYSDEEAFLCEHQLRISDYQ